MNLRTIVVADFPNNVINSWTQSLVITLNLCDEFTSKKMESKRKGRNSSSRRLFTWDGEYFYQGDSISSSKRIYTFNGKHLFQGDSISSSKIMYTFDGPITCSNSCRNCIITSEL